MAAPVERDVDVVGSEVGDLDRHRRFENANWLLSNDEFLGNAVHQNQTGDGFTDANLVLKLDAGTGNNGRMMLVHED